MVKTFTRTDGVDTAYAADVNDLSNNCAELLKYCRDTIIIKGTGSIDATNFNYPDIKIIFRNGNHNIVSSGSVAKPTEDSLIVLTVNRSNNGASATLSLVGRSQITTQFPNNSDNSSKVIIGMIDYATSKISWNGWAQDETTTTGSGTYDAETFAIALNEWRAEDNSLTVPNSVSLLNGISTTFATNNHVNTNSTTAVIDTSNKKVICPTSTLTDDFLDIDDSFNDSSIDDYWETSTNGTGNSVSEDSTQLTIIANANTAVSDAAAFYTKDPVTGLFIIDFKIKVDSTNVVSGNLNLVEVFDKTFSGVLDGSSTPYKDILRVIADTSNNNWLIYARVDDSNYYTWDETNSEWDKNTSTKGGSFSTNTDYYIRLVRRLDGNMRVIISTNSDFSSPTISTDWTGTGNWVTNNDSLKDLNEGVFVSVGDPYTNAGYGKFYVGLGKVRTVDEFWIGKIKNSSGSDTNGSILFSAGVTGSNGDACIQTTSGGVNTNVSFLRTSHCLKLDGKVQRRVQWINLGATENNIHLFGGYSSQINNGYAGDATKSQFTFFGAAPSGTITGVTLNIYAGSTRYSWKNSTQSWDSTQNNYDWVPSYGTWYWVEYERTSDGIYMQAYPDNNGNPDTSNPIYSNNSAPDGSGRPYASFSSFPSLNMKTDPIFLLSGDPYDDSNGGSMYIDETRIVGAEFEDNCNNSTYGLSDYLIFEGKTAGFGSIAETSGEIQFDSSNTSDGTCLVTRSAVPRGFDITIKASSNSNATAYAGGLGIFATDVSLPDDDSNVSSSRKCMIFYLGTGSDIEIWVEYVDTSNTPHYWTSSGTWSTTSQAFKTGISTGDVYYFRIAEDLTNSRFELEVLDSNGDRVTNGLATVDFSQVQKQSGSSYIPSQIVIGDWYGDGSTGSWKCDLDVDDIDYFALSGYTDSVLVMNALSKEDGTNITKVKVVYHVSVQNVNNRNIQFKINDSNFGSAITNSSAQKGVIESNITSNSSVTLKAELNVGDLSGSSPEILNLFYIVE